MQRLPAAPLLLLFVLALGAARAPAAQVSELSVAHAKGVFTARGTFTIDAPPAAVRAALTDYDHLDRLTPAILESRLMRKEAGGALVFTRSRACAGWFCRELKKVEDVVVSGDSIVATARPDQSDVVMSVTRWRVSASGSGTSVAWESRFDPRFAVPPLVGPALVKRALAREAAVHAAGIERTARERVRAAGAAPGG